MPGPEKESASFSVSPVIIDGKEKYTTTVTLQISFNKTDEVIEVAVLDPESEKAEPAIVK